MAEVLSPAWTDLLIMVLLVCVMAGILLIVMCLAMKQNIKEEPRKRALLAKRAENRKDFESTYKYMYHWDLVISFKETRETALLAHPNYAKATLSKYQLANDRKSVLAQLKKKGFIYRQFFSIQDDEIYCKVRAPLKLLRQTAHEIGYKVKYDPVKLMLYMTEDHHDQSWKKLELRTTHEMTRIRPFEYIFGTYHMHTAACKDVYAAKVGGSEFRDLDRLRLIHRTLLRSGEGEEAIDLSALLLNDCIYAFGGVHDYEALKALEKTWLVFFDLPGRLDVTPIKDYFGEKIGLYVVWEQHLALWQIPAALAGVLTWVYIIINDNDPNSADVPYFAGFIAVWATLVLESWKRRETYTAMTWGTSHFEEEEGDRPGFFGLQMPSPVDGRSNYTHFRVQEYSLRLVATGLVTGALLLVAVVCVLSLFFFGAYLRSAGAEVDNLDIVGVLVAILQSVLMGTFDRVFMVVAAALTTFENHRTETMHEDAIIVKTFVFRFCNNFAPMLYIAFAKPFIPEFDSCYKADCMQELKVSIATVFIAKMLINNTFGVLLPIAQRALNRRENTRGVADMSHFSEIEREFMRPDYAAYDGLLGDYAESVVLFGLTTLFISAFPLAALIGAMYSYVEMRIFAWKLCHVYRRPVPRCAQDIGTWYHVLELMSAAAVLTNAGIVAFTGRFAREHNSATRVWVFVGMSVLVLSVKYVVAFLIPDVPGEVKIQLERQSYFNRKLIHNEKDAPSMKTLRKSPTVSPMVSQREERKDDEEQAPSPVTPVVVTKPSNRRSIFGAAYAKDKSAKSVEATPEPKTGSTPEELEKLERDKFFEIFQGQIKDNDNEEGDNSNAV